MQRVYKPVNRDKMSGGGGGGSETRIVDVKDRKNPIWKDNIRS